MDTPEPPAPRAFISYSWDDDAHKEWVRKLAIRLREMDGVDVTLDRWHAEPGDQIPQFMERAVRENDFVIAICTPRFKERSDGRGGGVGYEGDIMTAFALNEKTRKKFIPVLRRGSWDEAAPTWLFGRAKVDLSGDPYSESEYEELVRTLHGAREKAPRIGRRPDFGDREGAPARPTPGPATPPLGAPAPPPQPLVTPAETPPGAATPGRRRPVVLCDFDGTMTVDDTDTTDGILKHCADPRYRKIEEDWVDGIITSRECMLCQTMCIPLDNREAMDAYLKTVRLDPGFGRFVEECRRLDVELIVNSDGFDHAIREVLANHGLSDLTYFSNALVFDFPPSHFLHFPNGNLRCMAAQGTCKCEIVARAAAGQQGVIVIGNDRTDACVARNYADFVFARPKKDQHPDQNDLVQACCKRKRRKTPYTTFGAFEQITRRLEELAEDYGQSTVKKKLYPWMKLTS